MPGTVSVSYDGDPDFPAGPQNVRKISVTWTSDGSGDATVTTKKISGHLLRGVTNPGSTAPTANYDITLKDSTHSVDLLGNCGDDLANRHTSSTENVEFILDEHSGTPVGVGLHPCVCDTIDIAVANAGDSKEGVLEIYWTTG